MIKDFEAKLSEITELHKTIQAKLSDTSIPSDMRIKLSKQFSTLEQVLACKGDIERHEKVTFYHCDQQLTEMLRIQAIQEQ